MPQLNYRVRLGPMNRIIVRNIALNGQLRAQLEANLTALDTLIEFIEQIVVIFLLDSLGVECLHACVWRNDVPNECLLAGSIDELESVDAEILLRCKALRWRLGVCDESQSRWMAWQVFTYSATPDTLQKLEELGSGASRESRNGMGNYIGVFAIPELESNTNSSWVGVAVCVGYLGDSG